jgi:hypothetical protein
VKKLLDFLGQLPPDRYCVGCLAQMSGAREDEIRNGLQIVVDQLDPAMDACGGCQKDALTYRLRTQGL